MKRKGEWHPVAEPKTEAIHCCKQDRNAFARLMSPLPTLRMATLQKHTFMASTATVSRAEQKDEQLRARTLTDTRDLFPGPFPKKTRIRRESGEVRRQTESQMLRRM